jgi:SAM-dependent methyltransferase
MTERLGFYERVLTALLGQGRVQRDWRVLVAAGGRIDRDAFAAAGFTDVTITNVTPGPGEELQDVESLTYADDSFDLAVISAGLHHCASPHRALLELYRVAGKGVLGLEARDSAFMRAAHRLGVVDDYELTAVADNDFASGGVRNSQVPNYVYRWTEREVEKTIQSAHPERRHAYVWFRELELPVSVLELSGKARWKLAAAPLRLVTRVFPKQANLFAFAVFPGELQPWMRDAASVDPDEVRRRLGGR